LGDHGARFGHVAIGIAWMDAVQKITAACRIPKDVF
jgi:hypothetical protein